jgi:hypothetical protein
MIATTMTVLALASALDLGISPSKPQWQTDYTQAMTRALEQKKPMAVFIGKSSDAIKQMTTDGVISADAAKVLTSSYVCVYVDTTTEAGNALAGRFEMKEGLVISSPGGNVQAYRYTGTVPAATLTRELTTYATAGEPITTVNAGVVPASGRVIVGGCANGSCGIISASSSSYYTPATSAYPFSGGCPNGRCPNQR